MIAMTFIRVEHLGEGMYESILLYITNTITEKEIKVLSRCQAARADADSLIVSDEEHVVAGIRCTVSLQMLGGITCKIYIG